MSIRVGFIGVGAMGEPMAGHLAGAGFLVGVWNRSEARGRAVAERLGVPYALSAEALAAAVEVLVLCVSADADVLGLVERLKSQLKPGSVVVDTSTVSPLTAQAAAATLAESEVGFLDCPVSGGVEGAVRGTLSVMVGGAESDLDRARPALECFAGRITHLGPSGSGQATKAVNQVLVAGIAQGVCEGLALAERLGLEPERLLATLRAGAAGNWFLDRRGETMLRDEFAVGFKSRLLLKDLGIVRALAATLGCSAMPVVQQSLEDYAALVESGHGDEDISCLIRRKRAG